MALQSPRDGDLEGVLKSEGDAVVWPLDEALDAVELDSEGDDDMLVDIFRVVNSAVLPMA